MSDAFDPYYAWLGIPSKHQPADYFRLLGVDADETDPNVIDHASKQRKFAVCLDAAGQEISSTVGTTQPLSDARPTGRLRYSKAFQNGRFELADVFLRSGDKPSTKVIEQKGNNFTLIGSQSLEDTGGDIDNLMVMIAPIGQWMSIRGKLQMMPSGYSAGGFVVYMDRNKNERPDPGEPQTRTARTGDFNFSFSYFPDAGSELLKIKPQTDMYRTAILGSTLKCVSEITG